jgi:hypothetical protein
MRCEESGKHLTLAYFGFDHISMIYLNLIQSFANSIMGPLAPDLDG